MAMELAILSFVCAALLAVFIPVRRICMSVPNLAIVLWFIGYNLIHGVNALVWAGNVDIHIPVWCDIVTKLMLGANIALPGALLSIARQLELASSSRTISSDKIVMRNRTILELFLCYIVPMLYMSLHLVAQDHRFDLVEDYGCSASIHPSTLAFLIIWIPPLAMCGLAFVVSGISIHNIGFVRGIQFTAYLEARSTMTSSIFYRRLATCMIMAGALILISLSSLFSVHSFQPWTSWSSVHALMAKIEIVQSQDDITNIHIAWWAFFAATVLYIVLSFVIGEEARDSYRWIAGQAKRRQLPKLILPMYNSRKQASPPEIISRSSSFTKTPLRPLTIELKSGWDDLLDDRKSKRKGSKRSSKTPSPCSSPTPSSRSMMDEDQQFIASTMSYLSSPTAKTLGIAPPLQFPPAAMSPPRAALEIPPTPSSPPPMPKPRSIFKPPRNVPEDVESTINSVFDASWPVPPDSPTPSLSRSYQNSRSRSHSPASSAEETIAYPLYPTITPLHHRTRPFEGSSISSFVDVTPRPTSPPARTPVKRPSIRSLRRSWSKERLGQGHTNAEVIHMTVVQETV